MLAGRGVILVIILLGALLRSFRRSRVRDAPQLLIASNTRYKNLPVEFDPERVLTCLETKNDEQCRPVIDEISAILGVSEMSALSGIAIQRFRLLERFREFGEYLDHVNFPHYAPPTFPREYDYLASIDLLFHIVRSRRYLAAQALFWPKYLLSTNDSLSLMHSFLRACVYADAIKSLCSLPIFISRFPASPGLSRRCSDPENWAEIETEIMNETGGVSFLMAKAKRELWRLTAAIPAKFADRKAAASLVPVEYRPEASEMCQKYGDGICIRLVVSFLNEIGMNPLPSDHWEIEEAVLDAFFRYPDWDHFYRVRSETVSNSVSIIESLNAKLKEYQVPQIRYTQPFLVRFPKFNDFRTIRPLMGIFDSVRKFEFPAIRRKFWSRYFSMPSQLFPIALFAIMDHSMMRVMAPALRQVCQRPRVVDWSTKPRLEAFRLACTYSPGNAEEMFKLFTEAELDGLLGVMLKTRRHETIVSLFENVIDRLSAFEYVSSDERDSLERQDCPICLTTPGKWMDTAVTPCKHQFCVSCLFQWLETHNTCPSCRGCLPLPF